MVHHLEQNVQSAKSNVAVIKTLMSKWSLAPLYDRKDGKKDGLLYIEVYFIY